MDTRGVSKVKGILLHAITGIVIALAGWLIVDAVMAVLYNQDTPIAGCKLGVWSSFIILGNAPTCLAQQDVALVPGTCSVPALTPITDPLALQMEGGQTVIWTNTDPQLQKCANKFISQVGGSVSSAYRPQAYQTHLWEIRDRWCTQGLQSNSSSSCSSVKSAVSAEVTNHFGLKWDCGAVSTKGSSHSAGTGVDISGISNPESVAVLQTASSSCLTWPNYSGDPYHYNLQPNCTCN